MRDATAVLLTVCRAAHLARARGVARALAAALSRLKAVRAKQMGPNAGDAMADAHTAGGARVLAEQLASLLATGFAHVEPLGPSEAAALPALGVGLGGGAAPPTHCLDPRLLCFEFSMGLVLRPQQVQLLRKLVPGARAGRSLCHQMLMGEGKTTVISPLLALLLADGSQLLMQIVPAPLLAFSLGANPHPNPHPNPNPQPNP